MLGNLLTYHIKSVCVKDVKTLSHVDYTVIFISMYKHYIYIYTSTISYIHLYVCIYTYIYIYRHTGLCPKLGYASAWTHSAESIKIRHGIVGSLFADTLRVLSEIGVALFKSRSSLFHPFPMKIAITLSTHGITWLCSNYTSMSVTGGWTSPR